MSSYNNQNQNLTPEALVPSTTKGTNAEHKIKLYQAVFYSIPICLSLIVLFIYYVICLYRRISNVDWSSITVGSFYFTNNVSTTRIGLNKDLREMLSVVIFGENFIVNDSQCSVCLEDYQAGKELQQIAACGHTFHIDCIDTWLTSHFTCPLCRLSLIPRVPQDRSHQTPYTVPYMENSSEGASAEPDSQSIEAIIHIDDGQEGNGDIR